MLLASLLACLSCKSPATDSPSPQANLAPKAACLFTLKASSSSPAGATRLTEFLDRLFSLQEHAYVNHVELENLKTVVIAVPGECERDAARKLANSVDGMLKQYRLPYTREEGVAEPSRSSRDRQDVSTLSKLLSIASNGQAQLKNCAFVFDFNPAASTTVEQEQSFRAKLEDTRRYGVPLLYSFILDEKLDLVFYEQCQSGLKAMGFVQAALGPLATQRLLHPRPASPQEIQRLLEEAGGAPGEQTTGAQIGRQPRSTTTAKSS